MVGAADPVATVDVIWEQGGAVGDTLWNRGGLFNGDPGFYLAGAAVCGLVRSAQSENPGRLVLADLPAGGDDADFGVLCRALAGEEPELAGELREPVQAVTDGIARGLVAGRD